MKAEQTELSVTPDMLLKRRFLMDLSAREVARRAGLSTSTVTHIELGLTQPTPRTLRKIMIALELPWNLQTTFEPKEKK